MHLYKQSYLMSISKSTLFGIHRDRYFLEDETREMTAYLSIGQKRMISLLMKQTLCYLISLHHGKNLLYC